MDVIPTVGEIETASCRTFGPVFVDRTGAVPIPIGKSADIREGNRTSRWDNYRSSDLEFV